MNKLIRWVIFIVGLAVLLAGGYYWLVKSSSSQAQMKAPPVTKVMISKVELHSLPLTLSALGTVIAPKSVTLSAQSDGVITEMDFQPGQRVKKGQLLFKLENQEQRAELAQQQATLVQDQLQLKRYQKLAKADPEATSQAQLDIYQAAVKAQAAVVAAAKKRLADTQVRAPFTGEVSAVVSASSYALANGHSPTQINLGSYVNQGDALVDIVDKSHLSVAYSIPQQARAQIKVGQQVKAVIQTEQGNVTLTGKVVYIAPSMNLLTRSVTVHAQLQAAPVTLEPGAFVTVTQVVDPNYQQIAVPGIALVGDMSGLGVYSIKDGRVTFVPVETGEQTGDWVAIKKGLKVGDKIITQGQGVIHVGMSVKVVSQ